MIRIGEIAYANCVPICAAFRKMGGSEKYAFVQGEPAMLNRILYAGEIDVAPCSSFEYALHPKSYLLIPDLSISSEREVKSVLLTSRWPIKDLNGKTVLLSPASATSNVLVRVLLEKRYGHRCTFGHPEKDASPPGVHADAKVTIGNPALKSYLQDKKNEYVYDLSLLWNEFTDLPFVFALWVLRRDAAEKAPAEVSLLVRDLFRAREYAESHFEEIAAEFEGAMEIPRADLVRYWETISYDLSEDKIRSLRRYFAYAEELGLLPETPSLEFYRVP